MWVNHKEWASMKKELEDMKVNIYAHQARLDCQQDWIRSILKCHKTKCVLDAPRPIGDNYSVPIEVSHDNLIEGQKSGGLAQWYDANLFTPDENEVVIVQIKDNSTNKIIKVDSAHRCKGHWVGLYKMGGNQSVAYWTRF